MIWREKRVLLIVLGLLLAANAIFFFTYRVQYQQRLDDFEDRREMAENQLTAARASRVLAERRLASYRKIEVDVRHVYDDYWSTQDQRFTPMIAEVKRLAVASGIVPSSLSFDKATIEGRTVSAKRDTGGAATSRSSRKVPIGATEVGIAFSVDGTYEQVRRLINLLELSSQFIIIDELSLTSRTGPTLNLNLHVKTLFRDPTPPAAGAINPL